MVRYGETLWCDGCGVEIRWKPIPQGRLHYCCTKCLAGEVCDCREELDEYPVQNRNHPGEIVYQPTNHSG